MQEELNKIQAMMNSFSNKYGARIQVDTIKSVNLNKVELDEEIYIYDLKAVKEGD